MKASCKRTVDFQFNGNFSYLKLKTEKTIGGDSDCNHPTTLTIYIEQMQDVTVEHHSVVTMQFVGGGEFDGFHRAINQLSRELNDTYGDPEEVVS